MDLSVLRRKPYFLAFLTYVIIALTEFRNVLMHCSSRSVGFFGDAYSTMAVNWVMTKQPFPPWQSHTWFTGYPEGESFWTFDWWTSTLIRVPLYAISILMGPVCAYNVLALFGLIFSASCAWLLAHKVTDSNYISILAGLMFGFGPYLQSKITGHINYTFVGVYPLLIYLLMKLMLANKSTSIWIGISLGSFSYIDGYFFVPTVFLVGTFLFLNILNLKRKRFRLKIQFYFFITYVLSQTPLLYLFLSSSNSENEELPSRDWNELNVYSIKFWHFFVPPRDNVYFRGFLSSWAERNLGGSNFSETSLFPGFTFLTLALVCTLIIAQNRKRVPRNTKRPFLDREVIRNFNFLFLMAVLGIFLSFKPIMNFLGVAIPLPSGILFHFAPYFRTISRWGVITTVSLIIIGALGFKLIIQNLSLTRRRIAYGLISALIIVDLGIPNSLSPKVEKVIQEDGPYYWVSQNTEKDSVVLDLVPFSVDSFFFGHLLSSERRMANFTRTPKRSYQEALLYPNRLDFHCALSKAKVDYLIFHPELSPERTFSEDKDMLKVFEFYPSKEDVLFDWRRAEVFKVTNSTQFLYEAEFGEGFELKKDSPHQGFRFLNQVLGNVELLNSFANSSEIDKVAYLNVSSVMTPEFINVQFNGSNLWSGLVNSSVEIPIRMTGKSKNTVKISRYPEDKVVAEYNLKVEFQNSCRS